MTTPERDIFAETLAIMNPGDCLLMVGGTFPGQNEEGVISLHIADIMPFMNVFYSGLGKRESAAKHPEYKNPIDITEEAVEVTLKRSEKRFRFDHADPWFRYGKRIATVGAEVVDLVIVDSGRTIYFLSKPTPEDVSI